MGTLTPPTVPPTAAAARRAWAALQPMHNLLYFDSKIDKHYASIGIVDPRVSYFAARACALGPVGPEPVTAMFYNFNPITVASSIPRVWEMAEPAAIVRARFEVA